MFEFDPMEPGNPMFLGLIEENYNKDYVDGYSSDPFGDYRQPEVYEDNYYDDYEQQDDEGQDEGWWSL